MTGDRESGVAYRMGARWPLYSSTDHLSYFSARAMRKVLEDNGFSIIREEWRFVGFHDARLGMFRAIMKLLEIVGLTCLTYNDHYYCFAKKEHIGHSILHTDHKRFTDLWKNCGSLYLSEVFLDTEVGWRGGSLTPTLPRNRA